MISGEIIEGIGPVFGEISGWNGGFLGYCFLFWVSNSEITVREILELKKYYECLLPGTYALRNYMKTEKICFANTKYHDQLLLLILNVLAMKNPIYNKVYSIVENKNKRNSHS